MHRIIAALWVRTCWGVFPGQVKYLSVDAIYKYLGTFHLFVSEAPYTGKSELPRSCSLHLPAAIQLTDSLHLVPAPNSVFSIHTYTSLYLSRRHRFLFAFLLGRRSITNTHRAIFYTLTLTRYSHILFHHPTPASSQILGSFLVRQLGKLWQTLVFPVPTRASQHTTPIPPSSTMPRVSGLLNPVSCARPIGV